MIWPPSPHSWTGFPRQSPWWTYLACLHPTQLWTFTATGGPAKFWKALCHLIRATKLLLRLLPLRDQSPNGTHQPTSGEIPLMAIHLALGRTDHQPPSSLCHRPQTHWELATASSLLSLPNKRVKSPLLNCSSDAPERPGSEPKLWSFALTWNMRGSKVVDTDLDPPSNCGFWFCGIWWGVPQNSSSCWWTAGSSHPISSVHSSSALSTWSPKVSASWPTEKDTWSSSAPCWSLHFCLYLPLSLLLTTFLTVDQSIWYAQSSTFIPEVGVSSTHWTGRDMD